MKRRPVCTGTVRVVRLEVDPHPGPLRQGCAEREQAGVHQPCCVQPGHQGAPGCVRDWARQPDPSQERRALEETARPSCQATYGQRSVATGSTRIDSASGRSTPCSLAVSQAWLPAQRQRRRAVARGQARAVHDSASSRMAPVRSQGAGVKSLLTRCHTLDCTCCVLTATSADLDSIVEFGLQNGVIRIGATGSRSRQLASRHRVRSSRSAKPCSSTSRSTGSTSWRSSRT